MLKGGKNKMNLLIGFQDKHDKFNLNFDKNLIHSYARQTASRAQIEGLTVAKSD